MALLTLVVGLVLLAVGSIAVVGAITSARSVNDLQDRYFHSTSEAISYQVRLFLEPALTTLEDTRTQILDAVRGTEVDSFERAIDAHVKNIRRKLERDAHRPRYLLTVYGIGYKFAES